MPDEKEKDDTDKFVGTSADFTYLGPADQINVVREEPEQE